MARTDEQGPFLMHATGFKTKSFLRECTKIKFEKNIPAITQYESLHHNSSAEEILRRVQDANDKIRLEPAFEDEEPTTRTRAQERAQVRRTFFNCVFCF